MTPMFKEVMTVRDEVELINPMRVHALMLKLMKDHIEEREAIYYLIMDSIFVVRRVVLGGVGAMNISLANKRALYKAMLNTKASHSIIVVHNHPSGNLVPSIHDDSMTKDLKLGCEYMGFTFHDSLIVSKTGYYSYKENNKL